MIRICQFHMNYAIQGIIIDNIPPLLPILRYCDVIRMVCNKLLSEVKCDHALHTSAFYHWQRHACCQISKVWLLYDL